MKTIKKIGLILLVVCLLLQIPFAAFAYMEEGAAPTEGTTAITIYSRAPRVISAEVSKGD